MVDELLGDQGPERAAPAVQVPCTMIVGLGAWGAQVVRRFDGLIKAALPGAYPLVGYLTAEVDGGVQGVRLRTGASAVAQDDAVEEDPAARTSDQTSAAVHELLQRDQLTTALRGEYQRILSRQAESLAYASGVTRYAVGPKPQLNTYVVADPAALDGGSWLIPARAAIRDATAGYGQSFHLLSYACLNIAAALAISKEQARLEALSRAYARISELDYLQSYTGQGSAGDERELIAPFDLLFLYGLGLAADDSATPDSCAATIGFIMGVRRQIGQDQGLDSLITGTHSCYSPPLKRPACQRYASVGSATLFYPREQVSEYLASRLALTVLHEGLVAPVTAAPGGCTELAQSALAHILNANALPADDSDAFTDGVHDKIATDKQGVPLDPQVPEAHVAHDPLRIGRWPEELRAYELFAMSKIRGSWEHMKRNVETIQAALMRLVREQVAAMLDQADQGMACAEALVVAAQTWATRMQDAVNGRPAPPMPPTGPAYMALSEAIEGIPHPWALFGRAALVSLFAYVFTTDAVRVAGHGIAPANLVGILVGSLFLFAALFYNWSRWQALEHGRYDVLETIARRMRAATRVISHKLTLQLLASLRVDLGAEFTALRQLRQALQGVETQLLGVMRDCAGDAAVQQAFRRKFDDREDARPRWEGSAVWMQYRQWAEQAHSDPASALPSWDSGGALVPAIQASDLDALFARECSVDTEAGALRQFTEKLLRTQTPFSTWAAVDRESDPAFVQWADRFRERLLVWARGIFQTWREKSLEDVLNQLPPGALERTWSARLLAYSRPTVDTAIETHCAEIDPLTTGIVVAPAGEESVLAQHARLSGFEHILTGPTDCTAWVLQGLFGFPLEGCDFLLEMRGAWERIDPAAKSERIRIPGLSDYSPEPDSGKGE